MTPLKLGRRSLGSGVYPISAANVRDGNVSEDRRQAEKAASINSPVNATESSTLPTLGQDRLGLLVDPLGGLMSRSHSGTERGGSRQPM